ncbi:MAG: phosphatidate cytidylyltransferase [Bradymonadaceae bacterium]
MSDSSSDLVPRLVTAVVGIPVLLYLIIWAPAWAFFGLIAAAGSISVWEYCSMIYGDSHVSGKVVATATTVGVLAATAFASTYTLEVLVGAVIVIASYFLFTFSDRQRTSQQMSASIMALVYGSLFLGALLHLHDHAHGGYWVILTLVTAWMSDTGAYFTGRAVGNTPLYASVSPNKTIEGSIGGLVGSFVGGLFCNWLFAQIGGWESLGIGTLTLLVVPAAILAQIGDLAESLIKRAHDADDSGSVLYGHGGLLDRIDGLIFAAPWFYVGVVHVLQ